MEACSLATGEGVMNDTEAIESIPALTFTPSSWTGA
jgi:hypothetical protein